MQERGRDDLAIVPSLSRSVYGCPGQLGEGDQPAEAIRGQYQSRLGNRSSRTRTSMMTFPPGRRMAKPKPGHHDLLAQVPDPLWEALADEAARERRSITQQLIHILSQRYSSVVVPQPGRRPGGEKRRSEVEVSS
jgi:hypothetical protein